MYVLVGVTCCDNSIVCFLFIDHDMIDHITHTMFFNCLRGYFLRELLAWAFNKTGTSFEVWCPDS